MAPENIDVHHRSPTAAKIALFRSLFRGREDVYPRRFESRKSGKCGYQPACANEWAAGICQKPKVKCAECSQRSFLPVTDDVIRWHLSGQDNAGRDFVMGVYPMLRDETCFFLAADFDKLHWQEDAAAILETCRRMNVPAALERSRSGNGGHVWFFFAEAIPAALARRLGAHILTETMDLRPDIGLDSYDRFFPNQDTLPQGGFGNLIALPLQKRPRDGGNSVFVDEAGLPYSDQWAFLSAIRRIDRAFVEDIVHDAERRGRIIGVRIAATDDEDSEPWTLSPSRRPKELPIVGPLPKTLELILGDQIYVAKDQLAPGLRNRLLRLAAFQNPEFYKAQAMRLPTFGKPRIIACAEDHAEHIGLPRGCLDDVQRLLADLGVTASIRDERRGGTQLDVQFQGDLRPEQEIAARAMLAHDTGVLSATTAFGKTVVAAWLIAQRGVNTLILVHRRQLLQQWVERLSTFLDLPSQTIGRIGAGQRRPTGALDVAVIQSLVRKGVVDDSVGEYGQIIVDECHHLSAPELRAGRTPGQGKICTGPLGHRMRKDGHHPIIFMQCGPVRHRVDTKAQAAARPFQHTVLVRPTSFRPLVAANPDVRIQFQDLYGELIADEQRNRTICDEVVHAIREGRSPLVLTERNEHLDRLAAQLAPSVSHLVILRGGARPKDTQAVIARLAAIPENEERVLLGHRPLCRRGF